MQQDDHICRKNMLCATKSKGNKNMKGKSVTL